MIPPEEPTTEAEPGAGIEAQDAGFRLSKWKEHPLIVLLGAIVAAFSAGCGAVLFIQKTAGLELISANERAQFEELRAASEEPVVSAEEATDVAVRWASAAEIESPKWLIAVREGIVEAGQASGTQNGYLVGYLTQSGQTRSAKPTKPFKLNLTTVCDEFEGFTFLTHAGCHSSVPIEFNGNQATVLIPQMESNSEVVFLVRVTSRNASLLQLEPQKLISASKP